MSNIIKARALRKYFDGDRIKALDGIDLDIADGEFVAIMGPSGSGKSTLLNMLGGLDHPDSGCLSVAGQDLMAGRDLTSYRARTVGFVFQLHNLIPAQTALENVILPMFESRLGARERRRQALDLIELVGLGKRAQGYPPQLSGGERQRVAIARALANSPRIILADEPTGSLDSKSGDMIMDLLTDIWGEGKKTLVIVTHEESVGRRAKRIVRMLDGRVV
ncbi:MAG: ABC transporter ATP-binding protein [Actinomycetota bacterium]|nr:ABC transporter ATP-binding protein [Actinomycetota bacterium]